MQKLYEPLMSCVSPAWYYALGDKFEEFWVDSQNLDYHIYDDDDEMVKDKIFWVITVFKPVGEKATTENALYVVDYSSISDDEDKVWSFKEHKPIGEPLKYDGENWILETE